MSPETHVELQRVLELNYDELVWEVGNDISRSRRHALPPSPSEAKRLAENWWRQNVESLRATVCGHAGIKQISCDPTKNFQLAIEILDLIAGLTFAISPLKVCGLIVKRGLVALCGEEWKVI